MHKPIVTRSADLYRRLHGTVIALALMTCVMPGRSWAEQSAGSQANWKQPMTPWGEPDLRGIWPLNHLISTPFQRPEQFGERRFLTDEETSHRAGGVPR